MKYRAFVSSVLAITAVTAMTQAAIVNFTYTSLDGNRDLVATGAINVIGTTATFGDLSITGSGSMDGVYTLVPGEGSEFPFLWDSYFDVNFSTQYMTDFGLLFMNGAGDRINIWANAPSEHSLIGHINGDPNQTSFSNGSGIVTIVPAPGALALLGFAGLVGARRRRS